MIALRHRVNILRETSDDGDDVPAYASRLYYKVPCNVVPVSGLESYRGKQLDPTISHVIEMRFLDGVTPAMRLYDVVREVYYEIKSVIRRDGRERVLEIFATESVGV